MRLLTARGEEKKALVQERVGVTMSPAPLQLNSQATQVAIFSPAAGRSVANSCPHLSDIQPSDKGLGSKHNHVLQRRAASISWYRSVLPEPGGSIVQMQTNLENGQQWTLSPHSV